MPGRPLGGAKGQLRCMRHFHCYNSHRFSFFACSRHTWLQLPGAAQRSTTWCTPFKMENASSICKSLKALRARHPSSFALR